MPTAKRLTTALGKDTFVENEGRFKLAQAVCPPSASTTASAAEIDSGPAAASAAQHAEQVVPVPVGTKRTRSSRRRDASFVRSRASAPEDTSVRAHHPAKTATVGTTRKRRSSVVSQATDRWTREIDKWTHEVDASFETDGLSGGGGTQDSGLASVAATPATGATAHDWSGAEDAELRGLLQIAQRKLVRKSGRQRTTLSIARRLLALCTEGESGVADGAQATEQPSDGAQQTHVRQHPVPRSRGTRRNIEMRKAGGSSDPLYGQGDRVRVWFPSHGAWFQGMIESQSAERGGPAFWVQFDDGERHLVFTRKSNMKHVHQEDTDEEQNGDDNTGAQLFVTGADQCSICKDQFEEMEEDDKVIYELSCRHAFCANCIEEWFQSVGSSNECPNCRRRFAGLRTCARAAVGKIRGHKMLHG